MQKLIPIILISTGLCFAVPIYGGESHTLQQDYNNGVAPVTFQFIAIETTNNYFNTCQAPARLLVSGSPYYIAILVDDTNVADANWTAYASSNVTVNLGVTEGWHEVRIGLRGHADAIDAAVWWWKRLKLDLTPPVLVITNPIDSKVSVPLIQLQGYSPEPLININYDLTNAAVLVTNQQVLVLDQCYSTNTWEFTTNTFQAFDVQLAEGLNTFTLHATDLAGNVTTTNFSFTLDYSSRTNPPPVQIIWPQNGTQISGTSFTLRGWVDDPSAKVMSQPVLSNGSNPDMYPHTYTGEVGRDGNFWLENLPLQPGTNTFAVTVTDAAGNVTVTNLSVVQSALVLTINPVIPDSQLWQPTVNLTGKISDPTYAVWVNGVKGKNNGDGTWSAANVPVNHGGTASFDATAYAPNEQQPDGSFGK